MIFDSKKKRKMTKIKIKISKFLFIFIYFTCEDDEIWFFSSDHPLDEDGGIEIGAAGDLIRQNVEARR